jgi:hypothetical protein
MERWVRAWVWIGITVLYSTHGAVGGVCIVLIVIIFMFLFLYNRPEMTSWTYEPFTEVEKAMPDNVPEEIVSTIADYASLLTKKAAWEQFAWDQFAWDQEAWEMHSLEEERKKKEKHEKRKLKKKQRKREKKAAEEEKVVKRQKKKHVASCTEKKITLTPPWTTGACLSVDCNRRIVFHRALYKQLRC